MESFLYRFASVMITILFQLVIVFITAMVISFILYPAWNWCLVPALKLSTLGFWQIYWLTVVIRLLFSVGPKASLSNEK